MEKRSFLQRIVLASSIRLRYLTASFNCVFPRVFQIHRIFQDSEYQLGFFQGDGRQLCVRLSGLWVREVFSLLGQVEARACSSPAGCCEVFWCFYKVEALHPRCSLVVFLRKKK